MISRRKIEEPVHAKYSSYVTILESRLSSIATCIYEKVFAPRTLFLVKLHKWQKYDPSEDDSVNLYRDPGGSSYCAEAALFSDNVVSK